MTRGFLSAALIVAVLGAAACALVIGDLPEATKSSTGGAGGTSGSGGESGGSAGESGSAGQTATGGTPGGGGSGASGGTGASGAGSGGGGGGGAVAGSGGAAGCPTDSYEPNETLSGAKPIDDADSCSASHTIPNLTLSGNESDWYTFVGTQNPVGCATDPTNPKAWAIGNSLHVCVYAKCQGGGTTTLSCKAGTVVPKGPGNPDGCCAANDAPEALVTCSVGTLKADVFISVDQQGGSQCIPYTLGYSY